MLREKAGWSSAAYCVDVILDNFKYWFVIINLFMHSNPLELSDEEAQSRDEDQQISSMWRTDNILVPTHTTGKLQQHLLYILYCTWYSVTRVFFFNYTHVCMLDCVTSIWSLRRFHNLILVSVL